MNKQLERVRGSVMDNFMELERVMAVNVWMSLCFGWKIAFITEFVILPRLSQEASAVKVLKSKLSLFRALLNTN